MTKLWSFRAEKATRLLRELARRWDTIWALPLGFSHPLPPLNLDHSLDAALNKNLHHEIEIAAPTDPATGSVDFWDRAGLPGGELITDAWEEERDQNALSWLFSQEAEALGTSSWDF